MAPTAEKEKARLQEHYSHADAGETCVAGPSSSTQSPEYSESFVGGDSTDEEAAAPPLHAHAYSDAAQQHDGAPPLYSGPASPAHEAAVRQATSPGAAAPPRRALPRYPGLLPLDYRLYAPPLFTLSEDRTTIKSTARYLSATATALANLVREQASIPPKPTMQITGQRGSKVDFSVQVNLMSLLVPEDGRRRMNYVRCVARNELAMRGGGSKVPTVVPDIASTDTSSAIEQWCQLYVKDQAPVKQFVLERLVANMDHGWLEGQVRSLVASTGYKGSVSVTFPMAHARVVVQAPDKVNKFFTSVRALFTGKSTYEVVKSVWPFATHRNGEEGRQCAVQSELAWWKEWCNPLRHAISMKRVGWVTNEDKLEALMEGAGAGTAPVEWGSAHS